MQNGGLQIPPTRLVSGPAPKRLDRITKKAELLEFYRGVTMATRLSNVPPRVRKQSRLLLNFAILLLCLVLARLAISHVFSVTLPDLLSLWGFTTAGAIGLFTSLLPKRTRLTMLANAQRLLGSSRTTVIGIAVLLMTAGACSIARYDIRWAGENTLQVSLNDRLLTLRSDRPEGGYHRTTRFGFVGRKFALRVGAYSFSDRPAFLSNRSITIPFFAVAAQNPRYAEVERALLTGFLQYQEQSQIEQAQRMIGALNPQLQAEQDAVRRLQGLHDTLKAIFVENSPQVATVRARDIAATYPQDPWASLLLAGAEYSARRYENCTAALSDRYLRDVAEAMKEIYVTARFFRGVCFLRHASVSVGPQKNRMNQIAHREFSLAEAESRRLPDSDFKDFSLPSSIIFQAIIQFYGGGFEEAVATFRRAFDVGAPDLRARAYNGAGYARFVQGRLDEASSYLNEALSVKPGFPFARSNYGYVLMSDPSRYVDARNNFLANVQDTELQRTSRRDVLLGRLSLIHLSELQNVPLTTIVSEYARLSREVGGNDWISIAPDELRYAYLARELSDRIYLNGQYFGVEILALTFLCRGKSRIRELSLQSNRDAVSFSAELNSRIFNLERTVNPAWLQQPGEGWFSALRTCHN